MVLNRQDIIRHISDTLDPEELIDRLGLDIETLAHKLAPEIMDNLSAFSDIYDPSEGEEELE